MSDNSGPEIIDKIKGLLRNQISLWNFHMLRYKGMNLTLQRRIENNIGTLLNFLPDKTKIVLAIRIKHLERLINDLKYCNPYKKNVETELQTYWTVILPEIKDVLKNFKDLNNAMKWEHRFEDIQIPEVLEVHLKPESQDPDTMSRITTISTATHLTTNTPRTRSILRSMHNVKSPTRRPRCRN